MNFISLSYIFFLGFVFTSYWLLRKRVYQNILLIISSYVFYMWWDYRFSALLFTSSIVDYTVGLSLTKATSKKWRITFLTISILVNLGFLSAFKYFNFFVESFTRITSLLGWQVDPMTLQVILPVGISFYTFQTMSYTIDVYRGKLKATRNLSDYLAYVSFFPQLVAGPIERGTRLLPQLSSERCFDYHLAADGCRQILLGFMKKMVLAENLALIVNSCYGNINGISGPEIFYATVCFGFQIYFDFSAYSDIAIGTGKLFGIELMRNFAYPYFSQSIGEFWRRWHISLSTWFRDYLYIPLGGSKVKRFKKAINVMIVFVVSGLWHGAAWHFIAWGAVNGLLFIPGALTSSRKSLKVTDVPGGEKVIPDPAVLIKISFTFIIVTLTWVFFRAQSIGECLLIFKKITTDIFAPPAYTQLLQTVLQDGIIVWFLIAYLAIEWIQRRNYHPFVIEGAPLALRWVTYTMVFWFCLVFTVYGSKPFIYFQF